MRHRSLYPQDAISMQYPLGLPLKVSRSETPPSPSGPNPEHSDATISLFQHSSGSPVFAHDPDERLGLLGLVREKTTTSVDWMTIVDDAGNPCCQATRCNLKMRTKACATCTDAEVVSAGEFWGQVDACDDMPE